MAEEPAGNEARQGNCGDATRGGCEKKRKENGPGKIHKEEKQLSTAVLPFAPRLASLAKFPQLAN